MITVVFFAHDGTQVFTAPNGDQLNGDTYGLTVIAPGQTELVTQPAMVPATVTSCRVVSLS